jgi:hypothetical protein
MGSPQGAFIRNHQGRANQSGSTVQRLARATNARAVYPSSVQPASPRRGRFCGDGRATGLAVRGRTGFTIQHGCGEGIAAAGEGPVPWALRSRPDAQPRIIQTHATSCIRRGTRHDRLAPRASTTSGDRARAAIRIPRMKQESLHYLLLPEHSRTDQPRARWGRMPSRLRQCEPSRHWTRATARSCSYCQNEPRRSYWAAVGTANSAHEPSLSLDARRGRRTIVSPPDSRGRPPAPA